MVLTRRSARQNETAAETAQPPHKQRKTSESKNKTKPLTSPNCVIAANSFFPDDEALSLGRPAANMEYSDNNQGRLSVRHVNKSPRERRVPHACWWEQLMSLNGPELISRLEQITIDQMIDYHGGVLTAQFVKLVCELYCHVCAQGDPDDGGIYGERSPVAPERLPKWYPRVDGAGFSREERLRMAVEYDAFQWYMISSENYSLLDTLVWMGVHVSKLFSRAGSPIYEASVAA